MSRATALDKQCNSTEARANEAKREAEELRSNLKYKVEAEGELVWKLASGRHRSRGRARETWRWPVGTGRGCLAGAMASSEVNKRVCFRVDYPSWSWYPWLPGDGAQSKGKRDGMGHRKKLGRYQKQGGGGEEGWEERLTVAGGGHYCWDGFVGGRVETLSYEIVSLPEPKEPRALLVVASKAKKGNWAQNVEEGKVKRKYE